MYVTLTKVKKSGLVEIAKQLHLNTSCLKKHYRAKTQVIRKKNYLVVGKKCVSTFSNYYEADEMKDYTSEEIKSLCRKQLRTHDLRDSSDDESKEEFNETIESCFYLHRSQVSQAMLKMMDKHKAKSHNFTR